MLKSQKRLSNDKSCKKNKKNDLKKYLTSKDSEKEPQYKKWKSRANLNYNLDIAIVNLFTSEEEEKEEKTESSCFIIK